MTEFPLKDFAEGYCLKNKVKVITIVTKDYDVVGCVYFDTMLRNDMFNRGIITKDDYRHSNGEHMRVFLDAIAKEFTKKTGIDTFNCQLIPYGYDEMPFTFNEESCYTNPTHIPAGSVLLHYETRNIALQNKWLNEYRKDFKRIMDNMQVCETFDDVIESLEKTCKDLPKALGCSRINQRIDFITELCKHITETFFEIKYKSDEKYRDYADAWQFIKNELGFFGPDSTFYPDSHKEYILEELKFKKLLKLACIVKYKIPAGLVDYYL